MGFVKLKELTKPEVVVGDESWKIRELGLPDYWEDPVGFLREYLTGLIMYSEIEGERPGDIIFLCGRTPYDMYDCLDRAISEQPGPYLLFGVLLCKGFRVTFYKWEIHEDGRVTKDVCNTTFNFNRPDEVRDVIGPTIRGMFNEVETDVETNLKVLKAGEDVKMVLPDEFDRFDDYPDRDVLFI